MFVKHFLHIAGNHDRPLRIGTQIDHISDRIPCIQMLQQRFHVFVAYQDVLKLLVQRAQLPFAAAAGVVALLVLAHLVFRLVDQIRNILAVIGFGHAHGQLATVIKQLLTHISHLSGALRHRMGETDDHELVAADAVDIIVAEIGARRVRKLAQHHVASGMTQMIIDLMQANQIYVHHRQRLVMGGLDEFHIIVESVAVEQPRQ